MNTNNRGLVFAFAGFISTSIALGVAVALWKPNSWSEKGGTLHEENAKKIKLESPKKKRPTEVVRSRVPTSNVLRRCKICPGLSEEERMVAANEQIATDAACNAFSNGSESSTEALVTAVEEPASLNSSTAADREAHATSAACAAFRSSDTASFSSCASSTFAKELEADEAKCVDEKETTKSLEMHPR